MSAMGFALAQLYQVQVVSTSKIVDGMTQVSGSQCIKMVWNTNTNDTITRSSHNKWTRMVYCSSLDTGYNCEIKKADEAGDGKRREKNSKMAIFNGFLLANR